MSSPPADDLNEIELNYRANPASFSQNQPILEREKYQNRKTPASQRRLILLIAGLAFLAIAGFLLSLSSSSVRVSLGLSSSSNPSSSFSLFLGEFSSSSTAANGQGISSTGPAQSSTGLRSSSFSSSFSSAALKSSSLSSSAGATSVPAFSSSFLSSSASPSATGGSAVSSSGSFVSSSSASSYLSSSSSGSGNGAIIPKGSPGLPVNSVRIRSNEKIFVDLSGNLANIHDLNDIQTVYRSHTNNGYAVARFWLGKNLSSFIEPDQFPYTSGRFALNVKRELLDHFIIESVGAVHGELVGELEISGFSQVLNQGQLINSSILIYCDNSPPLTWSFGALTYPGFGGFPLHQYFPGNPADWTIKQQTYRGQFYIRSDSINNLYRMVLSGKIPSSVNLGDGCTASARPNASETVFVLFENNSTGSSWNLSVNFVGDRHDLAPWPATDNPAVQDSGNQLAFWMRYWPKAYGETAFLEDGNFRLNGAYFFNNDNNYCFCTPIKNGTFGPIVAPFIDDLWSKRPGDYNYLFSQKWLTIRSRTPFGGGLYSLAIDVRSLPGKTNNFNFGLRVTNARVGSFIVYDGVNPDTFHHFIAADHLFVQAVNFGVNYVKNRGYIQMSNYITGSSVLHGAGIKFIGNRFATTNSTQDSFNYASTDDPITGEPSEISFNLFMDKQGQESALHEDNIQMVATSGGLFGPPGSYRTAQFIGNSIWGGKRRITTLGKQAIGGQMFFMADIASGYFHTPQIGGNILVDVSSHGFTLFYVGNGTCVNRNLMIFDYNLTNGMSGYGVPQVRIGFPVYQGRGVIVKNNIFETSSFLISAGIYPQDVNNTWDCDKAWQTKNLHNAQLGPAAKDFGDILRAVAFRPNVSSVDSLRGPLADSSIIDHRRQTVDKARLFESCP